MSAWRRSPLLGVATIFAFTWLIGLALAAQSRGLMPAIVPSVAGLLIGYLVVAGAIAATALQEGWVAVRALLRRFLIWRVSPIWYAVGLFGFPLVYVTALALYSLAGGPSPDFGAPQVTRFVPAGLNLLVIGPAWFVYEMLTNGEEIGWRGYLLPRLQLRYSPLIATVIVVAVWAAWHIPKFLVVPAAYNYPISLWLIDIAAKGVIMTWLFNHVKGSLLLATICHASWNTAALCLPILPAANGAIGPLTVAIALTALIAIGLVIRDPQLGLQRGERAERSAVSAVGIGR